MLPKEQYLEICARYTRQPWIREKLSDLQLAALKTIFQSETRERFEALKRDLREAGYRELWVGDPPIETDYNRWAANSIFCVPAEAPKNEVDWWKDRDLSFWYIVGKYFDTSCGNGRQKYSQAQLTYPLLPEMYSNYRLNP